MRIGAVTGSVVFHSVLFVAAWSLPAPPPKHAQDPVTIDLFTRKPDEPAPQKVPEPEPPKVIDPPKLAMRDPSKDRSREDPQHELTHEAPLDTSPTHTTEPPKPNTGPPAGKLDLNLHALPPGSDGVAVPSGTGTIGGTGTSDARKPWKMRGDVGNPLTGKIADEKEDRFPLHAIGGGELEFKGKSFHARIGRDGRVTFEDKSLRDFKGLSGGFDITDMIMRAKHNDPYRAEKQAFMDVTENQRKKMAQAALKERMQASLGELPTMLARIWRDKSVPAAERRKLLYDTWHDAATSDALDAEGTKEACALIEVFVRRYLPNGTEDAFTDDELDRFNSGKKVKFAPYR